MPKEVDISPLKQFAAEKLPDSPLRDLILQEKNTMPPEEYVIKVDVWLKLLRRKR
jgi:hypothetical protein